MITRRASLIVGRRRALLLAVVVLGFGNLCWRASLHHTFWADEIFTVSLVHDTFPIAVEHTTWDAHPPLYYFAVKFWLKPFRILGIEPGLFLTRAFGLAWWLVFAGVVACAARTLIGPRAVLPAVLLICLGAQAGQFFTEARQYVMVLPLLLVCWAHLVKAGMVDTTQSVRAWIVYAVAASLALWTQLLSGPFLFVLGCLWLTIVIARGLWKTRYFLWGAAAHAAALISILPWIGNLRHNIGHLHFLPRPWQTPATGENLAAVFAYWFPLGQASVGLPFPVEGMHPVWYPGNMMMWLGVLALGVPLVVIARGLMQRSRLLVARERAWLAVGAAGIGTAVAYAALTWWTDRMGIARTFHGTRYPAVGLAPFVIGLIALVRWAVARLRWPGNRLLLVLAPWLVAGLVGHAFFLGVQYHQNLAWAMRVTASQLPPPGITLHVMPSEFIPYVRPILARHGYTAAPIESLPWSDDPAPSALRVNPVTPIYKPRDAAWFSVLAGGRYAPGATRVVSMPPDMPLMEYYRLDGVDPALAERFRSQPVHIAPRDFPADALAVAVPEHQSRFDGWDLLEFSVTDRAIYRWANEPVARVRFDRAVDPGRYRLHLRGFRTEFPRDPATIRVRVAGTDAWMEWTQPHGSFTAALALDIPARRDPLVLEVAHPAWTPRDYQGVLDPRRLTFLFDSAWLVAAE